jgi:PAS domain S-box-containing protein
MSRQASDTESPLFAGGGELGALMQQRDWSNTPLGPVRAWPRALKTAVRIILTSRQPMFVWWGKDLINLYNDAYKSIIGGKHPQALGQPAAVVWREIWDTLGPRAAAAMSGKAGTYDEALFLLMERNGYPEETYYTFSYSPVPDDEGNTNGIFCANTDDTQRMIGERQVALLREVAARTADARTIADACARSAQSLETNPRDLPFALIYLLDPDHQRMILAGAANITRGHRAAPEAVTVDDTSVWPFAEVMRTTAPYLLSTLPPSLGDLPTGAWDRPPMQAVALPIAPSGQTGRAGVLVVGLNPYRLFDDGYKGFLGLVSGQIAAALANAQAYEQERKRAEALAEIDRAKTLFFSNVSHEFRTPLTLMLGTIEEVLDEPNADGPTDVHVRLDTAHRNGLRLLKLVNSLLDFSRIEAGRVQAAYEPTDLARFTADLASVFRAACERAGLRLLVDCPPLPALVYVDRDMWEKIVLNLLSNAFKFTFAGEIWVTLRPTADGAMVVLTVQDTGIGIPAAEQPRLFERFHRVEGAHGRTHEGTGIGLALVQELVKLHSGQVEVESMVDHGSAFTVRLPFGVAHLPRERIGAAPTLASTATSAAAYVEEALRWLPEEVGASSQYAIASRKEGVREWGVGPSPLSPHSSNFTPQASSTLSQHSALSTQHSVSRPRVLLADDNADMRDYVRRLLSVYYEVTAVADGREALTLALDNPPDLMLSDVMMPRLDGVGLLKALRTDSRTRTLPIILLTARAGEEARIEGLEAGADDYIVKPFSARELLARVSARLEIARLREEATRREQELRREADAARARVTTTLESITDAFFTLDRQGRFTYVNQRARELWGRPQEDFIGKHVWEEFPETEHLMFGEQVSKAMVGQVTASYEGYHPSMRMWLSLRAYPSSEGVAVYLQDISARKEAEAALAESEQRWRTLAEALPAMVWMARPDGWVEYYNQRWSDYTGLTDEQRAGWGWEAVWHSEDVLVGRSRWQESLRTGQPYEYEARLQRAADASYRWHLIRALPVRDAAGRITAWYGTTADIHDRKLLEKQLQENEERLRLALEAGRLGTWELDTATGRNWFSPETEALWGFAPRTFPGTFAAFMATIHPNDHARVQQMAQQIAAGQSPERLDYRLDYRIVRPDGDVRWIEAFGQFFAPTPGGPVCGSRGVVMDITERKQAEAERELLLRELQRVNEELQQFAHVVSHDLNEPLRTMRSYVQLLAQRTKGKLDAEAAEDMAFIADAAQRMQQMLADLLAYTRAGQTPALRAVDCEAVLAQVLNALQTQVTECAAIITHDPLPIVHGDATRLGQVLQNLIGNALKFCETKPPRIHITARQEDQHWRFAVRDNGIGIDPRHSERIFGAFQRLHARKEYPGTGMGLAICKKIVEQHGGRLWVESRPGEGSIFYFIVSDIRGRGGPQDPECPA